MNENESLVGPAEGDVQSPVAQVRALVDEVKALADAEIAYAKARIGYSGGIIRKAGQWALVSILLLAATAIALVLGILLIIAHYWGPVVATLTVVLFFAATAVLAAIYARNIARRLSFAEDMRDA